MVVIVDTGVANRHSIFNAVRYLGFAAEVSADPAVITAADKLIVPGVGAFAAGARSLHDRKLIAPLNEAALERRISVLGVCLGMQLMAEASEEGGEYRGLGWFPGHVVRLKPDDPSAKVPHVGFNSTYYKPGNPLFDGLPQGVDFYYVHSYHLDAPPHLRAAECAYGGRFTAAVSTENLYAVQFHPEKSQAAGLTLLRNFLERC